MSNAVLLGRILVPDFCNPRPEDVDVRFMEHRMRTIVRFNGHRAALTLEEHQRLTSWLAMDLVMPVPVMEWARRHDHHEYATGDVVRPLQTMLGCTVPLAELQTRWDRAICGALGMPVPTERVYELVRIADDIALGLEWMFALGRDLCELGDQHCAAIYADADDMFWDCMSAGRRSEIERARDGEGW